MEHCQTLEFLVYVVYNRIYRYRVNLPCSAVRDFFFSAVLVLKDSIEVTKIQTHRNENWLGLCRPISLFQGVPNDVCIF